jgi:hypothetical protein
MMFARQAAIFFANSVLGGGLGHPKNLIVVFEGNSHGGRINSGLLGNSNQRGPKHSVSGFIATL